MHLKQMKRDICAAIIIISLIITVAYSVTGFLTEHDGSCLCNTCEEQYNAEHQLDIAEGNQR